MRRFLHRFSFSQKKTNPFHNILGHKQIGKQAVQFYNLSALQDSRYTSLPICIKVLLQSAVRNCDEFQVTSKDIENILDWRKQSPKQIEIPFKPGRVILQDFTGVPAVVDLAAMRDAVATMGGDPAVINPQCPVDLVIDHSVQVDVARVENAWRQNQKIEFQRNKERFEFLKWGSTAFSNFSVVPPGSGIVHQVNLEYLARVVLMKGQGSRLVYPDSVVGTDSHTTMINGLGVVGWGVGGIEAEAVMLGQPISMVLPEVIGFQLDGRLREGVTATDLVLEITRVLRKLGVVGKFVEFFGSGCTTLSLADRATISNMAPEYGATIGYFPPDNRTIEYLELTNRSPSHIQMVSSILNSLGIFKSLESYSKQTPLLYTNTLSLNLSSVQPSIAGPKRPHDNILLRNVPTDFKKCITNPQGFKGFGIPTQKINANKNFTINSKNINLRHGSVVLAAITSCTNTSNPNALITAGLLAKQAVSRGLTVSPHIKTSLSPGSTVVTKYLDKANLTQSLNALGFTTAGYGCMTCIGNSGDLSPEVSEAITSIDCVAAAVLSGNRNFEARIHPLIKANYLASPALVIAYALAGRIDIDFEKQPIGKDRNGNNVFLKQLWPKEETIRNVVNASLTKDMFAQVYEHIKQSNKQWNELSVPNSAIYQWKSDSTYIHNPPFFKGITAALPTHKKIQNAFALAWFGHSITTDHISPAGNISKTSPAARYLNSKGVKQPDFHTYGARRGNDEVMARGTFANTRIINKLAPKVGPQTVYIPTGEVFDIYDAAERYMKEGHQTIILAGQEYGSGSSRDWAAKGPYLQGIKAVIAQSFERIHRSNLAGMGIVPMQFLKDQSAETLGLTGRQKFTIDLPSQLQVGQQITVKTDSQKQFKVKLRLDTEVEIQYYKNGGILHYVLRKLIKKEHK